MNERTNRFQNVLLCEDIRDEVGGKHSLMGVFSADITVPSFPAFIQLAAYVQYRLNPGFEGEINGTISIFQDDTKFVEGAVKGLAKTPETFVTFILPKAIVTFDRPCTYRIVIEIDGHQEEVLSKKILLSDLGAS